MKTLDSSSPPGFQPFCSEEMRYRLFVPDAAPRVGPYPLVLWMHDIFGLGSDNLRNVSRSNAFGAGLWTGKATQSRFPAYVFAPQCPFGSLWFDNPLSRQPSAKLRQVLNILDDLRARHPIDGRRIYLAGQSMGGWATWALLGAQPDLFAAAIPVAGAGRKSDAGRFAHIPIWAFHGKWDVVVPAYESARMITALREAGGDPRFTQYSDLGHGNRTWERVFSEPEILPWLFSQRRP